MNEVISSNTDFFSITLKHNLGLQNNKFMFS